MPPIRRMNLMATVYNDIGPIDVTSGRPAHAFAEGDEVARFAAFSYVEEFPSCCSTEAPRAVPPGAGLLSNDLEALAAQARHWLNDPDAAAAAGTAARGHALRHYGLDRFLADWDRILEKVTA
jgi:hypothetical protein